MEAEGQACSFCGLVRPGGVAGSTPDLYICPRCVRLARQMVRDAPEGGEPEPGPWDQ